MYGVCCVIEDVVVSLAIYLLFALSPSYLLFALSPSYLLFALSLSYLLFALSPSYLLFALSSNTLQYDLAVVTDEGVEIEGQLQLDTNWEVAHYVR